MLTKAFPSLAVIEMMLFNDNSRRLGLIPDDSVHEEALAVWVRGNPAVPDGPSTLQRIELAATPR